MPEKNQSERGLTNNILEHSIAFQGNSLSIYQEAVAQVRALSDQGRIYSPSYFPSIRESKPASGLQLTSESSLVGSLSLTDAVGVKVLLTESSALAQSFGISFETSKKLQDALRLSEGGWSSDAIDAFGKFGSMLGLAAGVRERMEEGTMTEKSDTWGDIIENDWNKTFQFPITQDNMKLGEHTSEVIVRKITEDAQGNFPNNPEGASTPEEIQQRIQSAIHGATLARDLYLEVVNLAEQELSNISDNSH